MFEPTIRAGETALVSESAAGDYGPVSRRNHSSQATYSIGNSRGSTSNQAEASQQHQQQLLNNWPQLSRRASEELVTILEFLVNAAERDPDRVRSALMMCRSPLPWFEQHEDPGPFLQLLEEHTTISGERRRPPLHGNIGHRCRVARLALERLVGDDLLLFDDGTEHPELTGFVPRIASNARGITIYGQLRGLLVYRGVVIGTAVVWLPAGGNFRYVFDDNGGSSSARERASTPVRSRRSLSPTGAAVFLSDLARGEGGCRRLGEGISRTQRLDISRRSNHRRRLLSTVNRQR